ncbi:MAG: DinB family protein [Phycisphaerales bacterium]|nr:MAG: DinB family protein [Phycisphaerales bacterium]
MNLTTIRELFRYNDWARDVLLAQAEKLDHAALDRPFEMGPGSLRKTLEHLFQAEWGWLRRWQGYSPGKEEYPGDFPTVQSLASHWRQTAADRDVFLDGLTDADLEQDCTFTTIEGKTYTFKLGYALLHVCNHGTHHRAQVVNMLRHLGVITPDLEFMDMIHETDKHDASSA